MNRPVTITAACVILAAALAGVIWRTSSTKPPAVAHPQTAPAPPPERRHHPASTYARLTDPSIRREVRVDMLRRMDGSLLSPQDIDTLYGLLDFRPSTVQAENWWLVANEIMEQLRLQAIAPDRFGTRLLAIINDSQAPEVLRDYALQHLAQWVSPRSTSLANAHAPDPASVRLTAETLARIATAPESGHSSISGTSLMLLAHLKREGGDPAVIDPVIESLTPWLADTLAGSNGTSKITRVSAINAIGALGLTAFRDDIRSIATSDASDPNMRLSSIATLGLIGDADDLTTLHHIAANNRRFHFAARSALEKLNASTP